MLAHQNPNLDIYIRSASPGLWVNTVRSLKRRIAFARMTDTVGHANLEFDVATNTFQRGEFDLKDYWRMEVSRPLEDPRFASIVRRAAELLRTDALTLRAPLVLFKPEDYEVVLGLVGRAAQQQGLQPNRVRVAVLNLEDSTGLNLVVAALR
jgi:hypothetical protein